jgi:hypothetical protein
MYLPPSQQQTDITGTWDIELAGQTPLLVLRTDDGQRFPFRLGEAGRGAVLLDGKAYAVTGL